MRSLGYLAWMFISFVYIVAVPNEYIWHYTAAFIIAVPLVNKLAVTWKDSNKNRKCSMLSNLLGAERLFESRE